MSPLFGDGIFTQEGDNWKRSRELLKPQFAHPQYDDLEIFRPAINNLIDVMPQQGIVDLQPLFFSLTLDITTSFLFGESVDSLRADYSKFAEAFDTAQDVIAKRLRLQDLYWLVDGQHFRESCADVGRFTDQIIDRNLDDEIERSRYVFLDSVAKESGDRTALRGHIVNALVAGRDTTACLLSWTLYVLSRSRFEISLNRL